MTRLELLPDALRVQTALTSRDVERSQIVGVMLEVRYSKILDTMVVLNDNTSLNVKPGGANAWEVFHAVKRWLA